MVEQRKKVAHIIMFSFIFKKEGDFLEEILKDLCSYENEQEWFEFKENWFEADKLGEYISALSNAAASLGRKEAYFVWGISDKTHKIIGTTFNQYQDYKNEPLQNYLIRNLSPRIKLTFEELNIEDKRIVVLVIPAAKEYPTSFKDKRFSRIGSAKVNLKDHPYNEKYLFRVLTYGVPTIINTKSEEQDLTFNKLFVYYASKGIILNKRTFKKNLGLLTPEGQYNMMARLLSDNCGMPLRVSIFAGKDKASRLVSVSEYGYNCILYIVEDLLRFGDVLNIPQADERNRVTTRDEIPLFNKEAYREAIVNAMVHNYWVSGLEPMISVFTDRIQILSRGNIPPGQTKEGFFSGVSVPVNEKLAEIFLQVHLSEKTGRGVPEIVKSYGESVFDFTGNTISVTIPFDTLTFEESKDNEKKSEEIYLSETRKRILKEMKNNPEITNKELSDKLKLSTTAIEKNIKYLKNNNIIKRVGNKRTGKWYLNK